LYINAVQNGMLLELDAEVARHFAFLMFLLLHLGRSCRIHYLSHSQMSKLESSHPLLMLHLYKLLSNMMAKQQEVTIGQLSTLHAIISSPARTKPIGRQAMFAFQELE